MSHTTAQSTVDGNPTESATTRHAADGSDFATDVADMIADHAPRVFAVVLEYGDQIDAKIVAWGLALDDGAYMATVDGRNQYAMAVPESALKYVTARPDTTPHLVWVDAGAAG
ncbi:hypothetical protein KIPE111705_34805 [Kibdelosporangium persicum]|uniref:hypothetical protein n=1 Tax=Kibdelosporangium persicum TaxID=2698649 RepID=UPI001564479C|nr:hypothetical protein [Kibdelosporangium persicum]